MPPPEDTVGHEAVRAGMELVSWQYTETAWRRFASGFEPKSARQLVTVFGVLAMLSFLLTLTLGTQSANAVWLAIGGVVLMLAFALTALAFRSRRVEDVELAPPETPPAVTVTALGIIVGDYARLWRDDSVWLFQAYVAKGQLSLVFETHQQSYERWCLPIPEGMDSDVTELVELLRAKTPGAERRSLPSAPAPRE